MASNNIISNVADIFALGTLGMMFGCPMIDYSKIRETLKRVVTNKGSNNDIAELAKVLNCPIETLKEAIESIKNETNNINVKP